MTNKNFGILKGNQLEYAPNSFKTDTGIIINPPKEMYIAKGYYEVIDNKPETEPNCFVKFDSYEKDDEAKTITFTYAQQMIPIVREVHTYSKLKLEMALFKLGKTEQFDCFLDETMMQNEFGQELPLRRFYDTAQDLASDNEYFETYLQKAEEFLGIDDEMAKQILEQCEK